MFNPIRKNINYIITGLILVMMFALGPVRQIDESIPPMNQFLNSKSFFDANYPYYKTPDLFLSSAGDNYRVAFQILGQKNGQLSTSQEKIRLSVLCDFSEKKIISEFSIPTDNIYATKEFVFDTSGTCRNIVLEKIDKLAQNRVYIKNINISRLKVSSLAEAIALGQSVVGEAKSSEVVIGEKGDQSLYTFTARNKRFAQIFKADGDILAGASLKLRFIGNGGYGSYQLELRKAVPGDGGQFIIGDEMVSSFAFNSIIAKNSYAERASDIYKFPLPAKLESGQYYAIVLDASYVKTNFLNSLQIYGHQTDENTNPGGPIAGKLVNSNQLAYLKVHLMTRPENNLGLNMARVEEIGQGEKVYSYSTKGTFEDIIDAENISKFPLQMIDGQILSSFKNRSGFNFTFSFPQKASRVSIEIRKPVTGIKAKCYYSTNNKDWVIIDGTSKEQPDMLFALIAEQSTDNLFIKVVPEDSFGEESVGMYGIALLKVLASLK